MLVCFVLALALAAAAPAPPPSAHRAPPAAPAPGRSTAPPAPALARRSTVSPADPDRDTLAWVGPRGITAGDLIRRIEWMPWLEKESGSLDSAKGRGLQSLVGEQLLAREAEREGLGDTGRVAAMRTSLRRALARDALFHEAAGNEQPPAAEVERIVRRRAPRAGAAQRAILRRAVADSLRLRSGRERAARYMIQLLARQRAVVDSSTFMRLAEALRARMLATPEGRSSGAGFAIQSDDLDVLLAQLRPALDQPLVRAGGEPIRLGEALEDMRFYTFHIHSLEPRPFAAELSVRLRRVVEGELLAREALARHLDQTPEVRRDLERWTDAWRARLLLERVAAGVDSAGGPRATARVSAADLRAAARADRVARYVANLADRDPVRWNFAALRGVDLMPSNMVTRRLLGFGGGMLASPSLPPLWQWVPIWRAQHPALP